MSLITYILVFGAFGVVALWGVSFALWKASFKYPAMVWIGTGNDINSGMWLQDRFKIKRRKGHEQIEFYKTRGKSYAPPFKWWSFWLKSNKHAPQDLPDGSFNINADIKKQIIQGAHFIKASDTELLPCRINPSTGHFDVLDHDSKELIIDDIERQNEITVSFKDKMIQLGLWLGSLLVIAVLAIVVIVLTFKYAGEQSAQIVATAQQAIASQPGVGG